ncbi:MAG: SCO family protein [Rickettsiales bacterium]
MNKILGSWIFSVLALVVLVAWIGSGSLHRNTDQGERGLFDTSFSLQSAKGPVTEKNYAGKYMLVYFGFTHCPDICPTTLLLVQNVLGMMDDKAARVVPIFITVDPERDTPKIMADYAAHFGPGVVGLSGTPAQIKTAADHYKVYYSKVEDKKSALGYSMDHSGFLYLVAPDGTYLTHFGANITEQALLEGLNNYVK